MNPCVHSPSYPPPSVDTYLPFPEYSDLSQPPSYLPPSHPRRERVTSALCLVSTHYVQVPHLIVVTCSFEARSRAHSLHVRVHHPRTLHVLFAFKLQADRGPHESPLT